MKIGYARVSTGEQNLDLQIDELTKMGCEKIFHEKTSSKSERPMLQEAMKYCREGDTLVVWKLDRLGRSLKDLVTKVQVLQENGIGFHSLKEHIDTSSSSGKFQFHVFSALAEFERDLIRDRTMAGLRAARARGRLGGRPKSMNEKQIKMASKLMADPETSIPQLLELLGVSRSTLYKYVGPNGEVRQK